MADQFRTFPYWLATRLLLVSLLCSQFFEANGWEVNPHDALDDAQWGVQNSSMRLLSRALPAGQCSATQPCADSSCCSTSGYCGLDPAHCGSSCISNCNAKAECGIGAAIPGATCPLNVCCSQYGYCGVTPDFCGTGCQSNCNQPGATTLNPAGNVQNIVIGYFEAWSLLTRSCRKRTVTDIPYASLTHLNVAFAYIKPNTYEIFPMPGTSETVIRQIANVKQQAPGLKWLSLGGWTYNDNGTDTQPVFGTMAASQRNRALFLLNLVKFMSQFGFDGVDFDWEYPGAPDRGGHIGDGANYATLLQEVSDYFTAVRSGWGVSFTAPTSYWYLRWFPVQQMVKHVSWMNLMTYDLHGSWDSPEDHIGSFVYAHTNLTEIQDALNLLWRNAVPANKVNLGIGFYGRSYTLSDPSCTAPGCPFTSGGIAGPCTGTSGVLSFDEIETVRKLYSLSTHHDATAGVNYFAFNKDQWVSYDDVITLKQKVDFANSKGLLGLFIWAVDLDSLNHDALAAVLYPQGLGKFKTANGVGNGLSTSYVSAVGNQCYWGDCDKSCPAGTQPLGTPVACFVRGVKKRMPLCCPLDATPDSSHCQWVSGTTDGVCKGGCGNQIKVAESKSPIVAGEDKFCFFGEADYCCDATQTGLEVCSFAQSCVHIDQAANNGRGAPIESNACPTGRTFVTYERGGCDIGENLWQSFCCDTAVDASSCAWRGSTTNPADCTEAGCQLYETKMGSDYSGGGSFCQIQTFGEGFGPAQEFPLTLCCSSNALSVNTVNLPVPLANLFPSTLLGAGPAPGDKQSIDLKEDANIHNGNDMSPNNNAFGFSIMSGPPAELITMRKRDGSHWELYDCPLKHSETRQTVKAICTNNSTESNCGDIHLGFGVAGTVVEMPEGCGPGSYAMAVSLEPSPSQEMPPYLQKRGLQGTTIYDFTFDYDFSVVQKRGTSNVILRIDYADDPGYWNDVVADPSSKKLRKKRELEIEQDHGGDVKKWLEHTWHNEKRSMDMHELHKKWFSADVKAWFERQSIVDQGWTGPHHSIVEKYRFTFFDERFSCPVLHLDGKFQSYADLDINVQASVGATLIGRLGDLKHWDESHVWFRTFGDVKASIVFDALAKLSFTTGPVEIFGAQNFGANFRVPGLVTIGPNFRLFGELAGLASLHIYSKIEVDLVHWDYTQQYPPKSGVPAADNSIKNSVPNGGGIGPESPTFSYNVDASGEITAHIKPLFTLGIVFDPDYLADASIDFGVDTYVRAHGRATGGSGAAAQVCYGIDSGALLFAQVKAPNMFGQNYDYYWNLWSTETALVPETCSGPTP